MKIKVPNFHWGLKIILVLFFQNTMKYPAWFPYPRCWGKALTVSLSWLIVTLICLLLWMLSALFMGPILAGMNAAGEDETGLFIFWMSLFFVPFPILVLSQIDRMTWTRPKSPKSVYHWLPSWRSVLEGIWAYFVSLLSILPPSIIFFFAWCDVDYQYCRRPTEQERVVIVIMWIIGMAYLYQLRFLAIRAWQNWRTPKKR